MGQRKFPSAMYLLLLLSLSFLLPAGALAVPATHLSVAAHAAGADPGDEPDRDLAESARRAAAILAGHQQGPGYWLTAYTAAPRFEKPRVEMNTFTNAMIVDIAGPVEKDAGLAEVLGRTRAFLASQIEADGLVRYHGRPDAPTIGRLGCVITPDADDTALAWRIAPGAPRERLSQALDTLGRFRAANGLYKTWLASRDRYRCIDPGRDPNPTDIGIQMHVLLLLAQVDRPAAHALCEALAKQVSDEGIWVYYRAAPLVPMLRLADLAKAGCRLSLPASRLQAAEPGQDAWIEVVRLLGGMERRQATPADYARAATLLRELGADGFSRIASAPPLLYHNDFTAHVKRFYWSEDVGYALWLRLYFEAQRARSSVHAAAPR